MASQTGQELLYYLAGIFDGEGNIQIARREHRGSRSTRYTLTCAVAMTDGRVPTMFYERFGGNLTTLRSDVENRRPLRNWRVEGKAAIRFLEIMRMLLVTKANEAWVGLEFMEQRDATKKGPFPVTAEELALREGFYWAMRNAKKLQVA